MSLPPQATVATGLLMCIGVAALLGLCCWDSSVFVTLLVPTLIVAIVCHRLGLLRI